MLSAGTVVGKPLIIFGQPIIGGNVNDPVTPKKSLGQHWLHDQTSLQAMCDAADVQAGDEILEIGPGTGSLTGMLMSRGANIFALELDKESIKYLQQVYARQWDVCLHVEEADVRTFNLERMKAPYKIVANIPYYLTSHLIQILSESKNPPSVAVLLVQKEVAERVCAKPGDLSLLGVATQFYWQPKLGQEVQAELFTPPPKVDSQILILRRREHLLFDVDQKQFFRIIKSGFSAKRKTVLNSLSAGLRIEKSRVQQLLDASNIPANRRPQELSLDDWNEVYTQSTKLGLQK